jgi:hypothetical protein
MYRRLPQKDPFVSGRILKQKKAMGGNNVHLFTGGLVPDSLSVAIAARIVLAKNDPRQCTSTDPEHIHLNMFLGISG